MKRIFTINIRALGASAVMWLWVSLGVMAQTPTVNLTAYQPTTVPSGATLEWHSDLPISAANLMTSGQVQAAAPGLYYAVYNLGGTPVCYSQPTPLKILTNACPTLTVDLKASVDSTGKPTGSVVSFHTDPVATDANRVLNTTLTPTASPVVYFVAYRDAAGCYTTANGAIVTVATSCVPCLAGTTAPIFAPASLTNTCATTTVSLAGLTNAGTKPAGTTLVWSTKKVPTSPADTLTSLTGISTSGKYYAMYFHKTGNCYSPADSVNVYMTDCASPLPPLPPPSPICDYSAPANVTLTVATEPAGYKKTYLLVDMANGKIAQVNATAPSFTGVGAGNYFAVAAYYNDTLKNAAVGSKFTSVYSTSECLKYSTPFVLRVCGTCDYTTSPVTITFPAAASPTAGVTTSYVLIDEKTNQIRQISGTASFAGVDTGAYAVVAVYRSKPLNLAVGDVLYSKVTVLDSCYETSNAIHYRVCTACVAGTTAPAITATTATNSCATSATVNLMTLTNTGTKPAGTTLVWSTKRVPTSASDTLANATAINTAGKYYALYYSKAGNCFSPADSVTVTLTACNCPAGTAAPIIATTSLTNTCPTTTVSLADLTNTGTKPAGTTLVWSTKKVPTSPADTLTSLTGISTGGKYYAMYYHKASNCYSPADSVAVYMTDCASPLPPLPPPSPVCDYSAPANVTLTAANEPAGLSKMYLLVDMANGQIVQTNATAPSFTNVGAGNYFALTAYYNGTLNNATVNKFIRNIYVSGTGNCLKYSTPLSLKVCAACDFNTTPATIAFTANPSPTAGITTTYVLIDEASNTIVKTSASASFTGVAEGSYAVAAVYSSGSPNLTVGASLYDKVTTMGSCLEVSNTLHYRVCTACVAGTTAPAITATTASNSCPTSTTVNLTTLINTGTKPAGTTLVWSTKRVPTSASDTLINATAINTAGKYYALYYSKAGNCFSPADSVTVTLTVCNCPAGTAAPIIATTSLTNTCPTTTVSLADLTNTGTKPAGTTFVWSTKKVPTSPADTLTSLTGISTGGKYYAMYYHKASNCYSPADSVAVYMTDCDSPLPPSPPPSPVCDYSAPANITLTAATEPAGFLKTYLLVDMANGQIVQTNATAPSFTNVGAGNYYAVAAYYKGTLQDATVGQVITNVSSSEGCLNYSTQLVFRVCGACDFNTTPATIAFTATPSPTAGITTTYVLIDEASNTIVKTSASASFAGVAEGSYAVAAVYSSGSPNLTVGSSLYDKVTTMGSCLEVSNTLHYRVCGPCAAGTTAPAITATTATNSCATSATVNLMTLANTGTKPAGTTLVWSTKRVPTSASDTLANATAINTAGKYYALYYSKAGNCFSPADSVTVTLTVCNCPAGTVAPIIATTSLTNSCPTTTVSLADLTNTGTKPAGTTLVWSTKKVPTSPADTLTSLTGISTGGKYYAMYYHKASNCYSPADSVAVYMTDCESPLPPSPPPSPVCDYSAPANITLTAATEPAGFLKTYLLVDMANGKIVQINATAPSFTNVGAGNYYAVAAYYKGTLEDATVGQVITNVSSSEGCLKYSPPLVFRVCGTCDFTTAPATITFTAAPSPTSGATTTYVLIDEYTNKIKAISGTASFAAVDTGYYAVVAVYRTKAVNFAVGDVLYDKVTLLDSCYTTSNSIHYRVCSAPQNRKPVATDDITQTPQDTPVNGNVLPNDFDPDGGVLTVSTTPTQQPTKGQVQLRPDGSYTYTPNPGATGTDKFCYRVCDNGSPSLCDTACVTINIIPALVPGNNKPVATDDNTQTYQNTAVNIKVKANDFDPDASGTPNGTLGNPTKLTDPANGTVSFNADGTVTYTPKAGFTGKDSFTYRICDNGTPALCDTATVSVEVLPPTTGNKPPVAVDDANQTTKNTPVSGTVAANDSDPDNNTPLTFSTLGSVVSGLTLNANGTYTYMPVTDFVGTVTQKYKVCDSGTPVACDTATLVITVLPPPVAKLLVKVLLQGALYGTTNGLMRDDLRSQNRIPLLEPYTALNATLGTTSTRFKHVIGGNETTTAGVLAANAGTANAVVDWVFVELRAKNDSTQVVQTVSALVQRDGDVVSATDGTSALTFTGLTNSAYFVSVKHRNHLGVMTNSAITMTTVGTLVDFTVMDSTQVWNRPAAPNLNYDGVEMNKTVLPGKKALWAGNAVMDFRLKYDGANTDLTKPLNEVLVDFSASTYNFNNGFGYKLGDINMDGKVKYAGANNDIIYIQNNVLLYRLNTGPLYNFNNMFEQIP